MRHSDLLDENGGETRFEVESSSSKQNPFPLEVGSRNDVTLLKWAGVSSLALVQYETHNVEVRKSAKAPAEHDVGRSLFRKKELEREDLAEAVAVAKEGLVLGAQRIPVTAWGEIDDGGDGISNGKPEEATTSRYERTRQGPRLSPDFCNVSSLRWGESSYVGVTCTWLKMSSFKAPS